VAVIVCNTNCIGLSVPSGKICEITAPTAYGLASELTIIGNLML